MSDFFTQDWLNYSKGNQGNREDLDRELRSIALRITESGLTNDEDIKRLSEAAMRNPRPDTITLLREVVEKRLFEKSISRIPFDKPSMDVSRPRSGGKSILMGKLLQDQGKPVLYPLAMLAMHLLALGASGMGKTHFLFTLALQFILSSVNLLVFDHQKVDFRNLIRFECAKDLIVARAQDLWMNFLQVPIGIGVQQWIVTFTEVFCKYMDLLRGSESFLIAALTSLYEDFGIFDGKDTYPTMHDLFEKIDTTSVKGNSRKSQFKQSILNRLEAFLALLGPASEWSKGITPEWIASRNMVIEVAGLTEHVARFYTAIQLVSLIASRMALGQRNPFLLRNAVIMDEVKYIIPPNPNWNLGFSPLATILSQARESNICLALADQTAQLEDSVFVNTRCKVIFRLGDGNDIKKVARSLSLTKDQEEYIPMLDTGEAIVRIPGESPFLIKTMELNME